MTNTKIKPGYWVQTIYAVIAPDGTADDYFYSKKAATKEATAMNKEKRKVDKMVNTFIKAHPTI